MRRALHFCFVLTLLLAARPSAAQDTTSVRLIGEVRDIATEQPIASIAVKLIELGLVDLTDRNGFFSFDSIPPGRWTFEASGFGYTTSVEASEIGPRSLLLIRLAAAPIRIEGLYVSVVQRLVSRRMATPSRVFAWDRDDLAEAISPDVGAFIRRQGVAQFADCGGEFSKEDLPNCILYRGGLARLRIVIDDVALTPAEGTGRLWSYDPRDLWGLEFLPGCDPPELRIYTRWFMEQVEAGRMRLQPMICVP